MRKVKMILAICLSLFMCTLIGTLFGLLLYLFYGSDTVGLFPLFTVSLGIYITCLRNPLKERRSVVVSYVENFVFMLFVTGFALVMHWIYYHLSGREEFLWLISFKHIFLTIVGFALVEMSLLLPIMRLVYVRRGLGRVLYFSLSTLSYIVLVYICSIDEFYIPGFITALGGFSIYILSFLGMLLCFGGKKKTEV